MLTAGVCNDDAEFRYEAGNSPEPCTREATGVARASCIAGPGLLVAAGGPGSHVREKSNVSATVARRSNCGSQTASCAASATALWAQEVAADMREQPANATTMLVKGPSADGRLGAFRSRFEPDRAESIAGPVLIPRPSSWWRLEPLIQQAIDQPRLQRSPASEPQGADWQ